MTPTLRNSTLPYEAIDEGQHAARKARENAAERELKSPQPDQITTDSPTIALRVRTAEMLTSALERNHREVQLNVGIAKHVLDESYSGEDQRAHS